MLEFIHFGPLFPKMGKDKETYVLDYLLWRAEEIDSGKQEFTWVQADAEEIYDRHHPPLGVAGIYAFLNRKEEIFDNIHLLPKKHLPDYMTNLGWYEIKKILEEIDITTLPGVTVLNLDQIKRIWIKMGKTVEEDRKRPGDVSFSDAHIWNSFDLDDEAIIETIMADRLTRDEKNMRTPRGERAVWYLPQEYFIELKD